MGPARGGDKSELPARLWWLLRVATVPGWFLVALRYDWAARARLAYVVGGTVGLVPIGWLLDRLTDRGWIEWSPAWVNRHWYYWVISGPFVILLPLGLAFAAAQPFR